MLHQVVCKLCSFYVIYRKVSVVHEPNQVIRIAVTLKDLSDASCSLVVSGSRRVNEDGMKNVKSRCLLYAIVRLSVDKDEQRIP